MLVRHIIIILSYPSFFFLRNLGRLPLQSQLVLYHGPTYCFNGFIRGEKEMQLARGVRLPIYSVTFNSTAIPASSAKCIPAKNGIKSIEYNGSIAK